MFLQKVEVLSLFLHMKRFSNRTFEELHQSLEQIFSRAKEGPVEEQIIRKNLEAFKKILSDPQFITSLPNNSGPNVPPKFCTFSTVKKVVLDPVDQENAKEFINYIYSKAGSHIQHKEIVRFAQTIGPKYGLYPSRDEKRNKNGMILWLRRHYDIIKDELDTFLSSKVETSKNS